MPSRLSTAALALLSLLLAGCEIPGMGPDPKVALREAEARAVGGACRHAVRGLEDCYTLNAQASKAAVFAGWKDMDQYMRDNKIEGTPSQVKLAEPAETAAADTPADKAAGDKKPAKKRES